MRHRHLDDPGLSRAAIDDIMESGTIGDWIGLRDACAANETVRAKAYEVARARTANPSPDASVMRHACWLNHLRLEYGVRDDGEDSA